MEIRIDEPWITDKVRVQNGYVYIDHSFWNAEKQQADHKREYIGKYDGESFVPNKNFKMYPMSRTTMIFRGSKNLPDMI